MLHCKIIFKIQFSRKISGILTKIIERREDFKKMSLYRHKLEDQMIVAWRLLSVWWGDDGQGQFKALSLIFNDLFAEFIEEEHIMIFQLLPAITAI